MNECPLTSIHVESNVFPSFLWIFWFEYYSLSMDSVKERLYNPWKFLCDFKAWRIRPLGYGTRFLNHCFCMCLSLGIPWYLFSLFSSVLFSQEYLDTIREIPISKFHSLNCGLQYSIPLSTHPNIFSKIYRVLWFF